MWPFNYFKKKREKEEQERRRAEEQASQQSWRKSVLHVKENVGWKRTVVKNLNVKPN